MLTKFRRGAGPHTGVHVIVAATTSRRSCTSTAGTGERPVLLPVDLPAAGRYHVLVDVYPAAATGGPGNFQLTHDLHVGTGNVKVPLPAYSRSCTPAG